jgi:hypothetical protein
MSISEQWIRARGKAVSSLAGVGPANDESREDSVRNDLTKRLERICDTMSRADFSALIVDMTREQLRGEGILGRKIRGH